MKLYIPEPADDLFASILVVLHQSPLVSKSLGMFEVFYVLWTVRGNEESSFCIGKGGANSPSSTSWAAEQKA
jgi:hypothetical protein